MRLIRSRCLALLFCMSWALYAPSARAAPEWETRWRNARATQWVGVGISGAGVGMAMPFSYLTLDILDEMSRHRRNPIESLLFGIFGAILVGPLGVVSEIGWYHGALGGVIGAAGSLRAGSAVRLAGGRVTAAPGIVAIPLSLAMIPLNTVAFTKRSRALMWVACGAGVGAIGLVVLQDQLNLAARPALTEAEPEGSTARVMLPVGVRGRF